MLRSILHSKSFNLNARTQFFWSSLQDVVQFGRWQQLQMKKPHNVFVKTLVHLVKP